MNKEQLSMGKKVEREHAPTVKKIKKNPNMKPQEIYTSIAKDHLNEFPDYYTGLDKMEKELKAKKSAKKKTKFEEYAESYAKTLEFVFVLQEAKQNISVEQIEKMITDYMANRRSTGENLISQAKRLGMTKDDVIRIRASSTLNPKLHNKEGMANKVKFIYEKAVGAKNSLYHMFDTFFHEFSKLKNSKNSDKIVKQMAAGVANALNAIKNEYALRDMFGHLTIPARLVLLKLLETSGVEIPVSYRAEGTNPALVNAEREAKLNPAYPMHDIFSYVALKALDEFIGKIPKDNTLLPMVKQELIKAVVGNKQTAQEMINYIKASPNYTLKSVSLDDYDASKIVLDPNKVKLTDTTYSDTKNPAIASSVEEQLEILRKLINT